MNILIRLVAWYELFACMQHSLSYYVSMVDSWITKEKTINFKLSKFTKIICSLIYYRLEKPTWHLLCGVMERFFSYNFPKPEFIWMKAGV